MEIQDFANRLKLLRIVAKLSVKKISEFVDVSENTYYKFEKGEAVPDVLEAVEICSLLVCDPNKLLGFPDKDPNGWSDYATRGAKLIDNMPLASQKIGHLLLSQLHLSATVKDSLKLSGGIDINDLVTELGL